METVYGVDRMWAEVACGDRHQVQRYSLLLSIRGSHAHYNHTPGTTIIYSALSSSYNGLLINLANIKKVANAIYILGD